MLKNYRHLLSCARSLRGSLFSTTSRRDVDISGILPPIVTPFNKDETIAYDKLKHNMDMWNKIPFKGYVVQGSNGEYVYLTNEERVELVKQVSAMAAKDKLIVAGAGCESTRDTIKMCDKMTEAGAGVLLVVTPCFYKGLMATRDTIKMCDKMTEAGAGVLLVVTPCFYKGLMGNSALISHYKQVADASPSPIILYSVPGNTGIDMPVEVVTELSSHPNIIGIKDSGGDIAKIGNIVYKTQGQDFQVLAGSASFLLASYVVGGVGGVLGLANVLGQECCDLERLYKDGKMEEAKTLQHRLIGPNAAVTKRFGMPGLKKSMEWKGYYGGPCRSPIQPLTDQAEGIVKSVFSDSQFV